MDKKFTPVRLILQNGMEFPGLNYGYQQPVSGEVVFNTGMTGYPETITDPSYCGQILVFTFPLIGNYGIPKITSNSPLSSPFESNGIYLKAVVTSETPEEFSHWDSDDSLPHWLRENKIPLLTGINTRRLTKVLREHGTMLGKIVADDDIDSFYDPDKENLLPQVSVPKPETYGKGKKHIVLVDCGCKYGILKGAVNAGLKVTRVPWDYDFSQMKYDGVIFSNGPGNPDNYDIVVQTAKKVIADKKPALGICLGHQVLSKAAGLKTRKMKYGHRGQNQPVQDVETKRCYLTSQNHGYEVVYEDNENIIPWFVNLNDETNEGMKLKNAPVISVQFHPEAAPGPVDTGYIFNLFKDMLD